MSVDWNGNIILLHIGSIAAIFPFLYFNLYTVPRLRIRPGGMEI